MEDEADGEHEGPGEEGHWRRNFGRCWPSPDDLSKGMTCPSPCRGNRCAPSAVTLSQVAAMPGHPIGRSSASRAPVPPPSLLCSTQRMSITFTPKARRHPHVRLRSDPRGPLHLPAQPAARRHGARAVEGPAGGGGLAGGPEPQARRRPGRVPRRPFSATPPRSEEPWDVPFAARAYPSLPKPSWAKCASVTLVSHARLDRVLVGRGYRGDVMKAEDMGRIGARLAGSLRHHQLLAGRLGPIFASSPKGALGAASASYTEFGGFMNGPAASPQRGLSIFSPARQLRSMTRAEEAAGATPCPNVVSGYAARRCVTRRPDAF